MFEIILLFSLISFFFVYFLYSSLFYLKILQIKEYRLDRIKDYVISGDFFRGLFSKSNFIFVPFLILVFEFVESSNGIPILFFKIKFPSEEAFMLILSALFLLLGSYYTFKLRRVLPKFTNIMKLVAFINLFFVILGLLFISYLFFLIIDFSHLLSLFVLPFLIPIYSSFIALISSGIVYSLAKHLRQKR